MNAQVQALLLAAGEGKRIGEPKAGLRIGGEYLLRLQAKRLLLAGCEPVYAVFGCHSEEFQSLFSGDVKATINTEWTHGPFSSLIAGLAKMQRETWSLVLPIDVFPVKIFTFQELISRIQTGPDCDAIVPCFDGKGGHPVLLSPDFVDSLFHQHPATSRLDHLLSKANVYRHETSDPNILKNINTPDQLSEANAAYRNQITLKE